MSLEQARFEAQNKQFNDSLNEQREGRLQSLGISNMELELRATQIANDFRQRGEEIDLRRIRDQAEIDLGARKLVQDAQLQGRSLSLDEARLELQGQQFQANLEAENERFYANLNQDQAQFARSLDEQRDLRLQNLGISRDQLEQEARRISQQDTSLSQQAARDQAEINFRSAQLTQQAALEGRSLDIQSARQQAEAKLGQDKLTEETAARLQQYGISRTQLEQEATRISNQAAQFGQQLTLEDRIRTAEVNLRTKQIANEYERSGQSIDVDKLRINTQKDIESDRLEFNEKELSNRKTEFDRNLTEQQKERELRDKLGSRELDIQGKSAEAQQQLARQQFLAQMMQALGFDPGIIEKLSKGDSSWLSPGAPATGQLSPDGAWKWDGKAWVPNTTTTVDDGKKPDDGGTKI